MSRTFGSGQVNGAPLLVTGTTKEPAQLLHASVADDGVPEIVTLHVINQSGNQQTLHLLVGERKVDFSLAGNSQCDYPATFAHNGGLALKAWADAPDALVVSVLVDNQGMAGSHPVPVSGAPGTSAPVTVMAPYNPTPPVREPDSPPAPVTPPGRSSRRASEKTE